MHARRSKEFHQRLVLGFVAFAVMVTLIAVFLAVNYQRAVTQNSAYLEASTNQTMKRLDATFEESQSNLRTAAQLFEATDPQSDADICAMLDEIAQNTPFGYVAFENASGMTYNSLGKVEQTQGRQQILNEGVSVVSDARIGDGSSIVFWEPVYRNGEYRGVVAGVWSNEMLESTIASSYFPDMASTYLCTDDGTIIAMSTSYVTDLTNVFDIFAQDGVENNLSIDDIQSTLESDGSVAFTYNSVRGTGTCFMVKLADHGWTLLRNYPATITDAVVQDTNRMGVAVIVAVGVVFAAFAVILLVQSSRKSKANAIERDQLKRVVYASSEFFSRFIVVDVEKGTYEYIKSGVMEGEIPARGTLSDFAAYWTDQRVDDSALDIIDTLGNPERIKQTFGPGVRRKRFEYRMHVGATKEVRWLQMSVTCLHRDAAGNPVSLLYAVQDLTDVRLEEARSRAALEDAFRAADQASHAKSDFLSSMSHDIRTPMNSIMGLTAIASMHVDDPDRVKDCLQKITVSSRHLLGLINEVLDMAKIESGKISLSEDDFDLPEAVENLLTIIHPQAEARHQHLKIDIDGVKHEHVTGDFMRLQQVLVNIMGNSVKFTPNGGEIGLAIKERPSTIAGCGCFEFTFTDTGCGMSEEFLQRLFEPFARANDNRMTNAEGTGLGMAIVKSVVSLMGGTIDVQSKLGEGTTFTVTVHMKLREVDEVDTSALVDLNVLVADNDVTACESACDILRDIGMKPDYVTSGDAAIARVCEVDGTLDEFVAVILDWKMPGKSGIETARELRAVLPRHVPIIILSAYDWMAVEQEARAAGIDAFVSKPLFKSRLVHVMNSLLGNGTHEAEDEARLLDQANFAGKRILLVEDNELAASIAMDILSFAEVQAERAENGEVAIEMLRAHAPGYYDLVLMDGQMPVMNGYDAARAIRALGVVERPDLAALPIVALTADAFADDKQRAFAAGMNAHMAKPLEIDELVKTLDRFLQD
ncbi:MAG: response regulator [Eggerthellaceae bacterium]|nr:response regulator [Eggerthellaceae bacterium]